MTRVDGCLCGALRYRLTGQPLRAGICHCLDCRKVSGSFYSAFAIWPRTSRRAKLAELVRDKPGRIQFSESFEGDAAVIFRAVDSMGLEGTVSKRADSRYKSGPSKSWLKAKCFVEADFEVLGVVREQGKAPLALLAAADGSRKYVGAAVIGLNRAMRERLWERVAGMPGRAPKGIPIKKPNAQWIKPGLVGHVRFLKGEGGLRHATLTEVRED